MRREIFKKAEKELASLYKGRKGNSVLNHYRLIWDNEVWENDMFGCYSDILGGNTGKGSEAFVSITTRHQNHVPTMEDCGEYIKWLIQDSPFARCFKRKSVVETVKEGIICNTNVPCNLFGGAILSHRMVFEDYLKTHIKSWNTMVQGGVLPSIAYMLMFYFVIDKTGTKFYVQRHAEDHSPLPSSMSEGMIENFIKGTYKEDDLFNVLGKYRNIFKLWGHCDRHDSVYNGFKKVFDSRFKDVLTPFKALIKGGATAEELVEIVLSFQNKLLLKLTRQELLNESLYRRNGRKLCRYVPPKWLGDIR